MSLFSYIEILNKIRWFEYRNIECILNIHYATHISRLMFSRSKLRLNYFIKLAFFKKNNKIFMGNHL